MESASMLNILDNQKLYIILSRLYFVLSSHHNYLFGTEEKDKLQSSLNISSKDLENVLQIIKNIIIESVQNSIQPDILQDSLISKGLNKGKAQVFSELWAENGKAIMGVVKKVSLAQWQMKGLSWEFHVESSSINTERQKHSIAVMDFSLFEPEFPFEVTTTKSNSNIKAKNVTLQMDKNQLLKFHESLNQIQDQIEALKQ